MSTTKMDVSMRHVVILLLLLMGSHVTAEPNWTSFRGGSGQGRVTESNLPLTWSETSNVGWKVAIPGKGWSSPVIWDNTIWLTTAIERLTTAQERQQVLQGEKQPEQSQVAKSISLRAIGLHRQSGEVLHDIELFDVQNPDAIHLLNSYASPTPVIECGRLYCHFGTYGTACVNTETGSPVWKRRLPTRHSVGPGSSPILWRDLLVLVCDGMDEQYVTALDNRSGETVWKTSRPPMEGDDGDFHKAFSTPLAIEWNGQTQLLVPGSQWFVSYLPSDGSMLWHVNHGKGFSNVAAPVFANGIAYMITGFTKPELWAIPVNSRGRLHASDVLWEQSKQIPKKSSPALIAGDLYLISDNGVLSCVDAQSGQINWTSRLGGNYSASPIFTEDRIYFCSHEGKTTVIRPNEKRLEILAENHLDGQLMASPVPHGQALFIRSDQHLYRVQESN